jgi:hypothetical protein
LFETRVDQAKLNLTTMEAALKQLISSNANFTGGAVFTAQGRVLATTFTVDKDEIEYAVIF